MRKSYAIANWKMNLPPEGSASYFGSLSGSVPSGVSVVVAPPFPYITACVGAADERIAIAAQNCGPEKSGAFTGEVSAAMLRELGAKYVILGHSERRNVFHEPDALVAKKLAQAIGEGLTPVLCIGEDLKVRDAGQVAIFLANQLREAAIDSLGQGEVIVAYEPIWAIGTGRNASGAMVAETVAEIRQSLDRFWPSGSGERVSILYGGSVTPDNVADLVANGNIDGFLVGGASLDPGKFKAIAASLAK